MAKGALYWRHKDEKTGKWTYTKVRSLFTGRSVDIIDDIMTCWGEE